jgi:carboxypeptidase T
MYGFLGVPSYTVELGGTFFESCSSFQGSTSPDNLQMLRYAARSLQAPYKLPAGPDTTAIGASAASVASGTPVTLTATLSDAVFSQVNGSEAVQAIASAKAYLDAPPWAPGATVIPLAASDGAFNASSETVTASIATSGLSLGVHTLYVQGTDAAGKPGTPNAVRFTVTATGNASPVANFVAAATGLTVAFTDTSSDSDGTIASRSWAFGDGTSSTSTNPVRTYPAPGSYTVTLTVTDNAGATASKSQVIVVDAGGDVRQTYVNDTDTPIPDAASVDSAIVVTGRSGETHSAIVDIALVHSWRGDLSVDLIASDGRAYKLQNRRGGSAGNLNATYKVRFLPRVARNGTWTLRVTDNASGDTGHIDRWSITF